MWTQRKTEALKKQMELLGIREEDIEEQFILASGKGGQKVGKTASAVHLHHKPSGIIIKCSKSRQQAEKPPHCKAHAHREDRRDRAGQEE